MVGDGESTKHRPQLHWEGVDIVKEGVFWFGLIHMHKAVASDGFVFVGYVRDVSSYEHTPHVAGVLIHHVPTKSVVMPPA